MEILASLFDAFVLILDPTLLLFVFFGVVLGIALGILPGLGGIAGMSILIAVLSEYQDAPMIGIAMAIGMIAVIPTSDTFASVLLGIPGSSSSQATVLDGFPLAKKGKAAQALSSAFTSSLFGGILGVIVLTLILAVATSLVTLIRTPAQFMLALFGISLVGILSGRSMLKGFLAAGLGVFVALIGIGPFTRTGRYFGEGSPWLQNLSDWSAKILPQDTTRRKVDGQWVRDENGDKVEFITGFIEEWQSFFETPLKIALVGLALFALPEIVDLLRRNRAIAGDAKLGLGWGQGFMDWWRNRFLSLWNAFIGVIVGIVPGLGGSVVDWIAYGQTKAIVAARGGDISQFGKGDIRGVIGPESANNAKEGGGLVPTLLLGLPGSGSMAIFIGILGLFGLDTGSALFKSIPLDEQFQVSSAIVVTGLVVVFFIAWSLMIANVMGTALCFGLSAPISRITKIPFPALAPFLILVVFFAVYKVSGSQSFYSLTTLLILGGFGVLMKRFEWSRPAFLIGFVLAKPIEKKFNVLVQNIRNAVREAERIATEQAPEASLSFVQKVMAIPRIDLIPIVLISSLIILVVVAGVLMSLREAREARAEGDAREVIPWRLRRPPILFLGLVTAIFAYMTFAPLTWGENIYDLSKQLNNAQLPHFFGLVFFTISLAALIRALIWPGEIELLRDEERSILPNRDMQRGLMTSFLWVAGFPLAVAIFGMWLGALVYVIILLSVLSNLQIWIKGLLVVGSMVLLTLLADLTNPKLPTGAIGRLVPDIESLEPIRDYLEKPQLIGIPK